MLSLIAMGNHVRAEYDANRRNDQTSINANNTSVNIAEIISEKLRNTGTEMDLRENLSSTICVWASLKVSL